MPAAAVFSFARAPLLLLPQPFLLAQGLPLPCAPGILPPQRTPVSFLPDGILAHGVVPFGGFGLHRPSPVGARSQVSA